MEANAAVLLLRPVIGIGRCGVGRRRPFFSEFSLASPLRGYDVLSKRVGHPLEETTQRVEDPHTCQAPGFGVQEEKEVPHFPRPRNAQTILVGFPVFVTLPVLTCSAVDIDIWFKRFAVFYIHCIYPHKLRWEFERVSAFCRNGSFNPSKHAAVRLLQQFEGFAHRLQLLHE